MRCEPLVRRPPAAIFGATVACAAALIDAARVGAHADARSGEGRARLKVELVRAFGRASEDDRRALGAAFGPDRVFDEVVVPALNR